jgi:hypothetical protein
VKQRKTAAGGVVKLDPKPKRTRQGNGINSKPSHGRKSRRGQGK